MFVDWGRDTGSICLKLSAVDGGGVTVATTYRLG